MINEMIRLAESRWHECSDDDEKMCLPCVKGTAGDIARYCGLEAARIVCPGCHENVPLVDGIGNGKKEYHADSDECGDLHQCLAVGIRTRFKLGTDLIGKVIGRLGE